MVIGQKHDQKRGVSPAEGRGKAMITRTWKGYTISKKYKNHKFPVYVMSIYKGKINWTTDYAHAKHYTEKTAKRINAEIDRGIREGKFVGEDFVEDKERR